MQLKEILKKIDDACQDEAMRNNLLAVTTPKEAYDILSENKYIDISYEEFMNVGKILAEIKNKADGEISEEALEIIAGGSDLFDDITDWLNEKSKEVYQGVFNLW